MKPHLKLIGPDLRRWYLKCEWRPRLKLLLTYRTMQQLKGIG